MVEFVSTVSEACKILNPILITILLIYGIEALFANRVIIRLILQVIKNLLEDDNE